MEARRNSVLGPPWLRSFLSEQYFTKCDVHGQRDRNFFCVNCTIGPLCTCGRSLEHKDHPMLQVRKASHNVAVRTEEIKRYIDISQIQTYIINAAEIIYLGERINGNGGSSNGGTHNSQQHKPVDPAKLRRDGKNACLHCCRVFADATCYFCSISCKLQIAKKLVQDLESEARHNLDLSLTIGTTPKIPSIINARTLDSMLETSEETSDTADSTIAGRNCLSSAASVDASTLNKYSSIAHGFTTAMNAVASTSTSRCYLDASSPSTELVLGQPHIPSPLLQDALFKQSTIDSANDKPTAGRASMGQVQRSRSKGPNQHPSSTQVVNPFAAVNASLSLLDAGGVPPTHAKTTYNRVINNCCNRRSSETPYNIQPVMNTQQDPPPPAQADPTPLTRHQVRRPHRRKGNPVRSRMF